MFIDQLGYGNLVYIFFNSVTFTVGRSLSELPEEKFHIKHKNKLITDYSPTPACLGGGCFVRAPYVILVTIATPIEKEVEVGRDVSLPDF